jgi:putative oxygen-independent coproporphyrinogen III oxidase
LPPRAEPGSGQKRSGEQPFGVYVHWPFCQAKCPYCDFNSHVKRGVDQARYARALIRELTTMAHRMAGRTVSSIFFGGGTPSLMEVTTVSSLLDAIGGLWTVSDDVEITLEANPTSVEADRFRGYRAAGVNRVSLGVQAMDDKSLKALGRLHTAQEALTAVALARDTFERVSFDLIYARPHQTIEDWRRELADALAYSAGHMSLYQLTIEEGTPFAALHAAGRLETPSEDVGAAMYDVTQELCEAAGLHAYEVSNHARPGDESRHNLVYWQGDPYAAAGPGAHGRLLVDGKWISTRTHDDPMRWLTEVEKTGSGLAVDELVDNPDRAVEILLMGLRLTSGVHQSQLPAPFEDVIDSQAVKDLVTEGLLISQADSLRVTDKGRPVLNAILREILV